MGSKKKNKGPQRPEPESEPEPEPEPEPESEPTAADKLWTTLKDVLVAAGKASDAMHGWDDHDELQADVATAKEEARQRAMAFDAAQAAFEKARETVAAATASAAAEKAKEAFESAELKLLALLPTAPIGSPSLETMHIHELVEQNACSFCRGCAGNHSGGITTSNYKSDTILLTIVI